MDLHKGMKRTRNGKYMNKYRKNFSSLNILHNDYFKIITVYFEINNFVEIKYSTTLAIRYWSTFPVVVYGCESWTIKKAERLRIDAFELWCWRRLLRILWTARRSYQSILKKVSPEYSLEGLMLRLRLQ